MTRGILLSSIAFVMLAAPAFAQDRCSSPVAPVVPDGKTSTVAQLVQANKDVVAFIKASDEYQNCLLADLSALTAQAKSDKKDLDPNIKKAIEAKGDANQQLKETVGKQYNAASAAYRAAHPK